jgi:hypothetical protein
LLTTPDPDPMYTKSSVGNPRDLEETLLKLLAYCRSNEWSGYDPYDALNSRVFQSWPFLNTKLFRLALTQALKRSPINIRALALVPRTQNAKGLALFLSGLLKVPDTLLSARDQLCQYMIERLIALRSPDTEYWCWGYSFPWQTRQNIVPSRTPNLVCTSFVANSFLDAYERERDPRCLEMAMSAARYILNELYWEDRSEAGFSYPLHSLRIQVHNANFLAAALLLRVYRHTREGIFLNSALKAARSSAGKQNADGSWFYGEGPFQRWIDNFHTGYNLCALQTIGQYAETAEFESRMRRGFEFYRSHFFREDGAAKYFHNRTYPIDIHCVAQSILTLQAFRNLYPSNDLLAQRILGWAMDHMWDDQGFFYYRVLRFGTIRTSYMRWSQAWMLLAICTLIYGSNSRINCSLANNLPALV